MAVLPVFVAVVLIAGAAAGVGHPHLVAPAGGVALAAWAVSVSGWWRGAGRTCAAGALCALAALGAAAGASAMRRLTDPTLLRVLEHHHALPTPAGGMPVRIEGRLLADAAPVAAGVLLRLDVTRVWVDEAAGPAAVEGRIVAVVGGAAARGTWEAWRAGRLLRFPAAVRPPTSYRNLGAPAPWMDLARRRAVLVASVKSAMLVDVAAHGPWLDEAAAALRAHARRALARAAGAHTEAAAVATAVLIGDRAGLSAALEARLQRAGTFHVLAISGGNIALWALLTVWLAARLTRRRPLALGAAAATLLAYAAVVGGGASVLRATGMALVGIAMQWLDQRGAVVNVLALTSAALVVADPLLVVDVGFWLTTAATAGLVLGLPASAGGEPPWRRWLRALVLTSVWAEAALLPLVAAVFQQVTMAGVVLSAVAIPAMAVVQVAAFAAVVADVMVPPLLAPCGAVLRAATAVVTDSARLVDVAPWLSWQVPPPSSPAVALYAVSVVIWRLSRRPAADTAGMARLRRVSAVTTPAAAVWIASSPLTLVAAAPGDLRVHVFDVGQGDATLVQFPNGRRMLVDAGGATSEGRDLGQRVVGPTLRARGVRRLDYLVITHADRDHIGGAVTMVRDFRPAEVWMGVPVADDGMTAALREAAVAAGASWREARRGDRIDVGGVRVSVLHPPPPDWERQRVRNDDSIVIALRYGSVGVLLPGDVGAAVEPAIVAAIDTADPAPPRLTVLKVAHHGSVGSTSQGWLAATAPSVAIVSAGGGNPFGHPAPGVLARLEAAGADVWRTDRDGEVSVRTDGLSLDVRGVTGRARRVEPQPR